MPTSAQALELIETWDAPYAAAGVVGRDRGVLAAHGDAGRPLRWASITKLVTAMAVLVAVEEKTISLDGEAGPEGATVRHLLAHAAGYSFDDEEVLAAPGERRIYSNTGYQVLAAVLAQRAGMPFERYLGEGVLRPLGMARTTLEGTAAAGLVGPLADMLLFASELLSPTLISHATLARATSVAFPGLAGFLPGFGRHDPLDWGLGFELRGHKSPHWTGQRNSPGTYGHFGGSGAFLWVDPVAGLACAALSGRDFDSWAVSAWPALSDAVLEEFAGTVA